VAWPDFEWGVEARSGHGCPAIYEVRQSDAAETSAAHSISIEGCVLSETKDAVLPRWGKTSVPARNRPRQDPRLIRKRADSTGTLNNMRTVEFSVREQVPQRNVKTISKRDLLDKDFSCKKHAALL